MRFNNRVEEDKVHEHEQSTKRESKSSYQKW